MKRLNDFIEFNLSKDMGMMGLTDEFFCVCLNKIFIENDKNILVVVNSLYEANQIYSNISLYNDKVYLFPMDDFLTSEALAISPDLQITRLETLNKILENDKSIIITNLMGYLRYLPNKKTYENFILKYKVGDIVKPSFLIEKLLASGYVRDTLVNKTGEIGVRGYIIDIFAVDEEYPFRIEFFDDEIESIRYFDPDTQKSIKNIEKVVIKPYFEFLTSTKVDDEKFGKQKYLPDFEKVMNIGEYLENPYTFFKDYDQLEVSYSKIMEDVFSYKTSKDINYLGNYMFDFYKLVVDFPVYYMSINNIISNKNINSSIDFNVKSIGNLVENVEAINKYIRDELNNNKTICICLKEYQLKTILKKLNMKVVETDFNHIKENEVNLIKVPLNKGFSYKNIVILTAQELFNIKEHTKKYNTRFKYTTAIKDIDKLSIGDYVVHNVHGIGIYNGIKNLTLNDISKDYLEVLYQGTDKIYIPVEKIDLLSKYSGKDGLVPKINKLGGLEWQKTKARVRKKVTDMADKLLALYAERESKKGFAFSKDCDMLHDFESDFPYELTSDQIQAIKSIKEDMEKPIPMDRLLCGDVGFGKTEVAFVAAFKAI